MDLDEIEAAIRTTEAPVVTAKEWRRARDLLMDSAPGMVAEIRRLQAENKRLRRFVTDQGTTCYSCESCGHARTTRECLRCENDELRTLLLETAEEHDELDYLSPQRLAQLRAWLAQQEGAT